MLHNIIFKAGVELVRYLYSAGAGSVSAIFTLLVIEAFVHLRFPQVAQPGYVGDAMWHLPKFGDKFQNYV